MANKRNPKPGDWSHPYRQYQTQTYKPAASRKAKPICTPEQAREIEVRKKLDDLLCDAKLMEDAFLEVWDE